MRAAIAPQLEALLDDAVPALTTAISNAISNEGKFHANDVEHIWQVLEGTFRRQMGEDVMPIARRAIEIFQAAMLDDLIKRDQLITPIPSQTKP